MRPLKEGVEQMAAIMGQEGIRRPIFVPGILLFFVDGMAEATCITYTLVRL